MQDNKEKMLELIGEKRYGHSIRVSQVAKELAKIYQIDEKKATIAAYYHDCGKIKDIDLFFKKCEEYGLELTEDMKNSPSIIHGHLGSLIARKDYGIYDQEILSAIRWHTTGKENMTLLEKIVFIADYIEPERKFEKVKYVRELAYHDLNRAVYKSLNNTIINLAEENLYIARDTILARNYIMKEIK